MLTILTLLLLTITIFILFAFAIKNDYETLGVLSFLIGLCLLMVLVGTISEKDITSEWIEVPVEVAKTNRVIVVDDGTRTWEFTDHIDFVNINDSTRFLFEKTTNIFGTEDIEGIKYTNQ
jgi:hypothetical protein